MKLVANICVYNEMIKGNLRRCLDNLKRYCDDIVVYDDGSEDRSAEIARHYTRHIILGGRNDQMNELAHKQQLLERAIQLEATHVFWLDADEVLDRAGTLGGLRRLCDRWPSDMDAYSFREINLWRGQRWARSDTLFDKARFVRLWKIRPGMRFDVRHGVHLRLYPAGIERIKEASFCIIHYGFWDYLPMLEKIGAHLMTDNELRRCAESNWILDERRLECWRLPDDRYPPGCAPIKADEHLRDWIEPTPRKLEDMVTAADLWQQRRLVDDICLARWGRGNEHGAFESIHARNMAAWDGSDKDAVQRYFPALAPIGKRCCDIGSGGGWHALECLRAGAASVACFEVSPHIVEMGRRSFERLGIEDERCHFVLLKRDATGEELPAYDTIYSLALFQHIKWWTARAWLRWIVRHLKPGGEVYLQFHRDAKGRTTFADSEESLKTEVTGTDLRHWRFRF